MWEWSGAAEAYRRAVVALAEQIVLATQHFPLLAGFPSLSLPRGDFVVLLAIALMAASIRVPWRRRVTLALVALGVTVGLQTLAAVASIQIESAQEMQRTHRILVLLPVEFQAVNQAKLTVYYAQLALVFVLFLITSPWLRELGAGGPAARRVGPARVVLGVAFGAALLAGAGIGWGRWRESDARHVAAHAKIGHLFWLKRDDAVAEEQYRNAVAGRSTDAEVYYNLAGIEAQRGRVDESARLLRKCAELGAGPVWQARVARAFDRIGAAQARPALGR